MLSLRRVRPALHISLLTCAVLSAAAAADAQSSNRPAYSTSIASSESSSTAFEFAAAGSPDNALAPAAPGAAQEGEGYQSHKRWSHLTFEAGGGGNGPQGSTGSYILWGGNFTLGAGYRIHRHIGLMAEYQLIDDKLPGALIAETGANGGHAHIWSFTLDPVIDLFPRRANDFYVTGGGGFYRKVTSFTDPQEGLYCDYYFCGIGVTNVVVGHFSSNQGGWNVGGGLSHKFGDKDSNGMKVFAEARYLFIDTPAVQSQPNGLGTTTVAAGTRLIPITLGVRW